MGRPLAAFLVPLKGDRLVGVSPVVRLLNPDRLTCSVCAIAFTDSG